jgi:uncharacterized protein (DUF305 family)
MIIKSDRINVWPLTIALTLALMQPVAWSQPVTASPASPSAPAAIVPEQMTRPGQDAKPMDMKGMDMQAMMKTNDEKMASMKMTGNADVDFAMMMRVHHQGAIDMAKAELRDGKNAQMRKLAKDIIAAQKREIAQLDKFLTQNGQPAGGAVRK